MYIVVITDQCFGFFTLWKLIKTMKKDYSKAHQFNSTWFKTPHSYSQTLVGVVLTAYPIFYYYVVQIDLHCLRPTFSFNFTLNQHWWCILVKLRCPPLMLCVHLRLKVKDMFLLNVAELDHVKTIVLANKLLINNNFMFKY